MAAYTLTVARTRARTHHLDDDGTRWSDTETDEALEAALSACMDEYCAAGGRHWATEADDVTASSGEYDMSSLNPLHIHGVSRKQSTIYYPLHQIAQSDVRRESGNDYTVKIFYTPTFAFPTSGANNLIGDSVSPPVWKAFDEWVCCRAALIMASKDDERLANLERVEQMLRAGIMNRLMATKSRTPSMRKVGWSKWLGYAWDPRTQKVIIGYRSAWGWF